VGCFVSVGDQSVTNLQPIRDKPVVAMSWSERVAIDPGVLVGKPVVRGTRLAVDLVIGLLAQGWFESDILRNHPGLSRKDIAACLQYESEVLQAEKVYPLAQG
jgi:uncharacterized protein (DUF433 family)